LQIIPARAPISTIVATICEDVRYNRASGAPPIALRIDGATSSYLTVGRFNRQGHALAAELISPKPGILVGTTVMPFAPEGSPIPYMLNDVEQATVRAGKGSNEPGLMEHGVVGGHDLEALIALWGTDSPAADVDEDATVGPRDLALLLANWSL
jgi:hypothetical protein